jgi:ABC-type transport system involved in multi-copper enzyme maturation permease subunit
MLLREEALVARHELSRNLRSKKGIAMFVLFVLGGAVPSVLSILIENAERAAQLDQLSEEQRREAAEQLLRAFYRGDTAVAHYLSSCPPVLLLLFQITMGILPLVALLIGFDQIAGEIQHRAIRYLAGRAHRHSIVIGKAVGVWAVVATMILVLHLVVWGVLLVRSDYPASTVLSWGLRFWAFSVAFAGAYAGLANLVSSWFKTPILALFIGVGVMFGMWLTRLIVLAVGDRIDAARWIYPATYEGLMVSPEPLRALGGCALSIAWGALAVAAATFIVKRRDL